MNIVAEKQNILNWIQVIDDKKTIEKILTFKEENDFLIFENKLILKGLNDVLSGNVSSHEDVKKRFEGKFSNKCKP
jgi:hypothetical protein